MSELRRDPVLGRWVIISSERAHRPSDFRSSPEVRNSGGFCPFCAGNEYTTPPELLAHRPDGSPPNGPGWSLRVVPNKFPALRSEGDRRRTGDLLFQSMQGTGAHEVIIETPDHDGTLVSLDPAAVVDTFAAFASRIRDLRNDTRLEYVAVFKNHGSAAGATLEHSHSQLIALPVVPTQILAELEGSLAYHGTTGRCIYCDTVAEEIRRDERIVAANEHFVALCPYASSFPFEAWILPRAHSSSFEEGEDAFPALAPLLQDLLRSMGAVLGDPDYNFVIHTSPLHSRKLSHYHWHIEVIPKLNNVAGFEWGSAFTINPTPPEEAALHLRKALTVR
jgi:UDPglucose--hexose-1-phosphate uridylyltransferase